MRWRIDLPDSKPPLSLNQRGHWAVHDGDRKRLRQLAAWAARAQKIPHCDHIFTRLVWQPPDNRRRDEDNIVLTAKPLWDGLVDAGVVDDDTSRFMTKMMPMILPGEKTARVRVWLEIWEPRDRGVIE